LSRPLACASFQRSFWMSASLHTGKLRGYAVSAAAAAAAAAAASPAAVVVSGRADDLGRSPLPLVGPGVWW
jgi:hypothetical protein